MIRLLLVDDQSLVRSGFRALLDAEEDLTVVGEAADGAGAVSEARRLQPDVVLMDIRMPGVDGIEATRHITSDPSLARTRVLVLTTFDLDEHVVDALHAGASGFLVKHTEPAELARAVRVVAAGDALLSPGVTRRLIRRFVGQEDERFPPDAPLPAIAGQLTAREREVVALVAEGRSNDEIAEAWVVSPATVRTHVSRSMMKLQARDRAQLVLAAFRYGLAQPPGRDPQTHHLT